MTIEFVRNELLQVAKRLSIIASDIQCEDGEDAEVLLKEAKEIAESINLLSIERSE